MQGDAERLSISIWTTGGYAAVSIDTFGSDASHIAECDSGENGIALRFE
jgi:hypothetical protein